VPNPDVYVERLKLKLEEWNDRIDMLQVLTKLARQEVQTKVEERMDHLRTKRDELESKVKEIEETGEEVGTSVKQGIEKVHSDMRETFDEVKSSLTT
jgi:chromosome segregation ATPase